MNLLELKAHCSKRPLTLVIDIQPDESDAFCSGLYRLPQQSVSSGERTVVSAKASSTYSATKANPAASSSSSAAAAAVVPETELAQAVQQKRKLQAAAAAALPAARSLDSAAAAAVPPETEPRAGERTRKIQVVEFDDADIIELTEQQVMEMAAGTTMHLSQPPEQQPQAPADGAGTKLRSAQTTATTSKARPARRPHEEEDRLGRAQKPLLASST